MRFRAIVCLWIVSHCAAQLPAWPVEEDKLRTSRGAEFVQACESLLWPMHCPAPHLFDAANKLLLDRLPTLSGAERQACLKALARTADDGGVSVDRLGRIWEAECGGRVVAAGRIEAAHSMEPMLLPYAMAMIRANRFQDAARIWDFLPEADFGLFDVDTFSALSSVSKRSAPRIEQRFPLAIHCLDQVLIGKIEPYPDLLRCALQFMRGCELTDQRLKLLVEAGLGDEKAVERLSEIPPTKGVARLLVMRLSDERSDVRDVARRLYWGLPEEVRRSVDVDVYYGEQLHSKPFWDALGQRNPRQGFALRYVRAELVCDALAFAKRLRDKGVSLKASDIQLLRKAETPEDLLDLLNAVSDEKPK